MIISDLQGQSENTSEFYKKPVNLNIQNINDYSGFKYIDSSIKDSRIILLGESSHTSKEYSLVKYKLIKYLHEKHGFNTVLFESGLSDCFYFNKIKTPKDSSWLLRNSIFSIWWSSVSKSMMSYLKSEQMTIGGFDYQRSGSSHSEFLRLIPKVDTSFIDELYKLDTAFSNFVGKNYPPFTNENLDKYSTFQVNLERMYKRLSEQLDQNISDIDSMDFKFFKRIISNNLFLIENYASSTKINALRDSVMGSNLLWFIDNIYKNEKIIIWGANDHIAKQRSGVSENFYAASTLPDRIKKESYFIGLFAFSGEMYSYPSNFEIKKPKEKSLENRIHLLGEDNDVFFDLKHNYKDKNFKWMSEKTETYHWGMLVDKIIPINFYDGIILINKTTLSRNFINK